MSLKNFLVGVPDGVNSGEFRVIVDRIKKAGETKTKKMKLDQWLTPKTVEGYVEEDFTYLTKEQRLKLTSNVDNFRKIAASVRIDSPATPEKVAEAREPLREIYQMVQPYLDRQYLGVRGAIEQLFAAGAFPDFVRRFDLEVGNDHTGDPAVWIWLIVDDSADNSSVFDAILQAEQTIADRLSELGIDRLVYGSVRTVSEQKERLDGIFE